MSTSTRHGGPDTFINGKPRDATRVETVLGREVHVEQREDGAWSGWVYAPEWHEFHGEIGLHLFFGIAATRERAVEMTRTAADSLGERWGAW